MSNVHGHFKSSPGTYRVNGFDASSRSRMPSPLSFAASHHRHSQTFGAICAQHVKTEAMSNTEEELRSYFAPADGEIRPEILAELESMLRLYSISPQELFYKWESYSIKMGADDTKLDLKTSRNFKKDIQDALERESRVKSAAKSAEKRGVAATPRHGGSSDVFGM